VVVLWPRFGWGYKKKCDLNVANLAPKANPPPQGRLQARCGLPRLDHATAAAAGQPNTSRAGPNRCDGNGTPDAGRGALARRPRGWLQWRRG